MLNLWAKAVSSSQSILQILKAPSVIILSMVSKTGIKALQGGHQDVLKIKRTVSLSKLIWLPQGIILFAIVITIIENKWKKINIMENFPIILKIYPKKIHPLV
jgi:hypothetical protein